VGSSFLNFVRIAARLGVLVVSVTLAAPTARADAPPVDDATRNAARELARDAVTAFDAGDYAKALDLLDRAHTLVPAPTITIFQARCLSRLGRLVEAMERYEVTRRTPLEPGAPPAFRDAVKDAARELEEVRERIPKLKIVVAGPGSDSRFLVVKLDGKPVPPALIGVARTVDPGAHLIEARVPGVSRGTTRLSIEEQAVEEARMRLSLTGGADGGGSDGGSDARSSESGSSTKTLGWVALGAGVTGLAVGVTGALIARGKEANLEESCDGSRCPPSAQDDLDAFRSARTLSFVGYGVGALGLIGGTLLMALPAEPARRESVSVSPWVGLGRAGIGGSF